MTTIDKILTQKAVRITPMRQLLLEYLVEATFRISSTGAKAFWTHGVGEIISQSR